MPALPFEDVDDFNVLDGALLNSVQRADNAVQIGIDVQGIATRTAVDHIESAQGGRSSTSRRVDGQRVDGVVAGSGRRSVRTNRVREAMEQNSFST